LNLYEYQAKDILRRYDLPTPEGRLCENTAQVTEALVDIGLPVMVKAQILEGGRGKRGLILSAESRDDAVGQAEKMLSGAGLAKPIRKVLVEQRLPLQKEFYLSVTVDELNAAPVLVFGTQGGVDIEELSRTRPETIFKMHIDPENGISADGLTRFLDDVPLEDTIKRAFRPFCRKLAALFLQNDCLLAEINPLGLVSEDSLLALDAKISIDDNALFRHADFKKLESEASDIPLENKANRLGFSYVKLDGNIGIVSHGAGLGMYTVDLVGKGGGRAANFIDINGSERELNRSQELRVKNELDIVLSDPRVVAVLFNVFGGLTRCDEVAMGIRKYLEQSRVNVPLVVRLSGSASEKVPEILDGLDVTLAGDLAGAVSAAVKIAGEGQAS